MTWHRDEIELACDELEQLLTAALRRLDERGNLSTLPRPEETTAGTCWDEHRQAVA